ncbi:MAG: radical SAM protein [Actinomycetota bacterium]
MIASILRIILARSVKPFIFKPNPGRKIEFDSTDTGLYFHIPFCEQICHFCPYYKIEYKPFLLKEFFFALRKEMLLALSPTEEKWKVGSIYFGGGSPALMKGYLGRIIGLARQFSNIKGNIAIELHPRNISEKTLEMLKNNGFDMVSIGIQSFQKKQLSALGREAEDNTGKLRLAEEFKFRTIDVDLIFGIPGQTIEDITSDFITAAENGATQISAYPFIEFSYAKTANKPLNTKQKKKMLESLVTLSGKMGYRRNSVWTFLKDGSTSYSSITRDNFIGFGPSAATLSQDFLNINTFSVHEYINCLRKDRMPSCLSLKFSPRLRALYWLFWSSYNLYLNGDNFYGLFGKKLDDMFGFEIYWAKKLRLIEKQNGGYKLTDKGTYLYHLVEQAYTRQYIDKTWRQAVSSSRPKKIILF